MRIEIVKQGNKWGYRIKRGRKVIGKNRRGYDTKGEANTVGQNHKQAIKARVDPRTGR